MDATTFLIERQRRSYLAELSGWPDRVRRARTAVDALRLAGQEPQPGNLLRSLRSLHAGDTQRSRRGVETALVERLDRIGDPREREACARMALHLAWAPRVVAWGREALPPRPGTTGCPQEIDPVDGEPAP